MATDIFYWTLLVAGCSYVSILTLSLLIIWIIKTKLNQSSRESVDRINKILHSYIEPLINGALLAIVFMNIVPEVSDQFQVLKVFKDVEKNVFLANASVFSGFLAICIISVVIVAIEEWLENYYGLFSNSINSSKRWLTFFSLGLHSLIEGFNIGSQKYILTIVALAIMTILHEIFILPLVVLKTFKTFSDSWINRYEVFSMVLYTSILPFGMVTGSLLMIIGRGSVVILVVVVIAGAAILFSVLTDDSFGQFSDRKRLVMFNISLVFIGCVSFSKYVYGG